MNIGFLGLGKLGLPVSLAVEDKGHNVFGYDISKQTLDDIKNKKIRYREEWVDKFLDQFRKTLETEMTDPQTRGRVEESEDGDSLKFKFITEFNFSIQRVKDSDE